MHDSSLSAFLPYSIELPETLEILPYMLTPIKGVSVVSLIKTLLGVRHQMCSFFPQILGIFNVIKVVPLPLKRSMEYIHTLHCTFIFIFYLVSLSKGIPFFHY